uniref:DUF4939 domain-containing protein n=1 Tax=Varanus komodoensis TaxID=61221 RepID=A0A8D2KWU2_VARKO
MQSPVPTIQDLQALREENSLLRTRYTEATKLMLHRCPLEAPPKYDDKKEGFTTFKAQCELYINLHLPDFPNKKMKVGFLINQLTVAPARWATARLITQDPILNDANLLLNALGNFLDAKPQERLPRLNTSCWISHCKHTHSLQFEPQL